MENPLIVPEGTKFRTIREDIANICGDIIEAAILDLFEYWTRQSPKYKSPGTAVWMRETCEIIQKQLGYAFLSITTIQRKINSLVSKNLLLTKRNKSSRSPNAKYYALNTKVINEQILKIAGQKHGQTQTEKETQPDTSCKMNPGVIPSFILNNEVGVPSFILNVQSSFILNDHLYNYSFDTSQGNPPKPACSPLADAIHPSPHPLVPASPEMLVDLKHSPGIEGGEVAFPETEVDRPASPGNLSDDPATEKPKSTTDPFLSQKEKSTEGAEIAVNSNNVSQGSEKLNSENQKIPNGNSPNVDVQCEKSETAIANFTQIDNRDQEKEDCTDKCSQVPDKYNSSARCDAKFNYLMPTGEYSPSDKQFLRTEGGQRLLSLMKDCGVAIDDWQKFLWYWAKADNFEVWSNCGYSKKTDVEKFNAIKKCVKSRVRNENHLDSMIGHLEGFQSRLRLAERNKQLKQQSPQVVDDGRRTRSKEEYEAIRARVEAERRAKLEAEGGEAIAS